mmetsp:Transcript_35629/g.113924  ORF Transcript_35629/g.113924 Transcript_35629/m.113924 type:complete len:273 (+) Transcript_35629:56-874(+)
MFHCAAVHRFMRASAVVYAHVVHLRFSQGRFPRKQTRTIKRNAGACTGQTRVLTPGGGCQRFLLISMICQSPRASPSSLGRSRLNFHLWMRLTCHFSSSSPTRYSSRNSSSNCSEIKPCSGRTSLSFTSSNSVTMRKASGAPVQNSLASHEPGNANFIAHKLTLKTVCLNGKSKTSTNSPIFCSMNTTGFLLGLLPLLLAPPLEAAEGSAEDVEDDDGVGPSSDEVAHSQGNGKGSPKSRPRRLRAAPSSRDRAVAFDRGSSGGTSVVVARA